MSAFRDAVVCGVWFLVAGVLGAVAWWQLVPTVVATQTEAGPVLQGRELEAQVAIDGWFGAIALALAVVSGVVLLAWRHRRPELVVALVAVGAGVAGLVMVQLGAVLGPADPREVLAGAAVGTEAPVDLRLQATGMAWLWPAGALLGALVQLLVLRRSDRLDREEASYDASAGGDPSSTGDGERAPEDASPR